MRSHEFLCLTFLLIDVVGVAHCFVDRAQTIQTAQKKVTLSVGFRGALA